MRASGERRPTVRLRELGVSLPEPPRPLGHYEPAVQTGALLVLSGMLPLQHGAPTAVGRLGDRISLDEGRAAARLAALNALATAAAALGSIDRIRRVVRVTVSMRTTPEFVDHAAVADGASELFSSIFDQGHTRTVLGACSLALGAAVLLDVICELWSETDQPRQSDASAGRRSDR
jgi:enamine deaminase RidA (YjgF/YER057c/UK114 family)